MKIELLPNLGTVDINELTDGQVFRSSENPRKLYLTTWGGDNEEADFAVDLSDGEIMTKSQFHGHTIMLTKAKVVEIGGEE